ncbi:hypothetical protein PO124_16740 [Bacillus licheniformis]|nr:hypothetical protein [Bacillus licheniformis]
MKRFAQAFLLGWVAFCRHSATAFGNRPERQFPVYALRSGISVEGVSIILPALRSEASSFSIRSAC